MSGELERQLRSKGPVKDAVGKLPVQQKQRASRQKECMNCWQMAASFNDESLTAIVWAEKVLHSPNSWPPSEAEMAAPLATSTGLKKRVWSGLETISEVELDQSPRVSTLRRNLYISQVMQQ